MARVDTVPYLLSAGPPPVTHKKSHSILPVKPQSSEGHSTDRSGLLISGNQQEEKEERDFLEEEESGDTYRWEQFSHYHFWDA